MKFQAFIFFNLMRILSNKRPCLGVNRPQLRSMLKAMVKNDLLRSRGYFAQISNLWICFWKSYLCELVICIQLNIIYVQKYTVQSRQILSINMTDVPLTYTRICGQSELYDNWKIVWIYQLSCTFQLFRHGLIYAKLL